MTATLSANHAFRPANRSGFPTSWEMIDPELATLYLERNTDNRRLDPRTVIAYAEAMRRGEWHPNGDTIRFSENDVLLNGQHTLTAIIQSGIPQLCLVVRGLPPEVFKTIDKQKRRTDAHDLSKCGFKHTSTLTSVIRLLWCYETYRAPEAPPERRLTSEQIIRIARAIPEISDCVNEHEASCSHRSRILPPKIGSSLWFMTRGVPVKRAEFFSILRADAPATKRNPAFALRERFSAERGQTKRTSSRLALALAFKAWNLFHDGRDVGTLKMAENEAFPLLKGYGDDLTATFPEWMAATPEEIK
jgi:hypothetical protein